MSTNVVKKERILTKAVRKSCRVVCEKMPNGGIIVNGINIKEYFDARSLYFALKPLNLVGMLDNIAIRLFVYGGGKAAQASACGTAIARTLVNLMPELRKQLSELIRTDDRSKERKKVGLISARKDHPYHRR